MSVNYHYTCHLCKNKLVETYKIGLCNPASLLRVSQEAIKLEEEFGLGVCSICKTLNNLNTKKALFISREFEWIKYSEPEYHFEEVLKKIKVAQNDNDNIDYVIGLSYKDASLVEKIKKRFVIKGSSKDLLGTTSKWRDVNLKNASLILTEEIENKTEGSGSILIIARRILDHCADVPQLLQSISRLDKKVTIYAEFNDYANEIFQGNLSFLWNERTFYPLPSQIELILSETGFQLMETNICKSGNNSLLYFFAKNTNTIESKINSTKYDEEKLRLKFFENLPVRSEFWFKTLADGKTCVIGASHKGISFSQIFLRNFVEDKVAIADGAEKKIGKYHPDHNLQIISQESLTPNDFVNFVITVDSKWYEKIKQKLTTPNKITKFYDFEGREI